jgi:hypothetical protein
MAGKIKKMIPSHGQDLNDNPALSKLEKYYSIKIE